MDAHEIKFRASSMGDIMSGTGKGWSVENSLTCKRKLVQMFREVSYKRTPDVSNKYTKKGNQAEEDAITLYSLVTGHPFKKNTTRLTDDFFTGETDIFKGESIKKAEETFDTKCSWSLWTFPSLLDTKDKDYEYQGAVYMNLTGAKKHTVVYCLVNTPANLIMDAKRRKAWEMGVIDEETEEYKEACIKIEQDSIFDMELFKSHYPFFDFHSDIKNWEHDIPKKERILEIITTRNDSLIDQMKDRIIDCRLWMNANLFK